MTASLVQRLEKCIGFIQLSPNNKEHVLELYELLKEAPKHTRVAFDSIKLWPYPRAEFYGKVGDRYNYCYEKCLLLGHKFILLDTKTEAAYAVLGVIFKGAFCFEMRQSGQEEPLRVIYL